MKKGQKTIKFLGEVKGLENVSMTEVKGGLKLGSYSGGCSTNDHQAVLSSAKSVIC